MVAKWDKSGDGELSKAELRESALSIGVDASGQAPVLDRNNPLQAQVFHPVFHTAHSVLVGAPPGSGKTGIAELAVMRLLRAHPLLAPAAADHRFPHLPS